MNTETGRVETLPNECPDDLWAIFLELTICLLIDNDNVNAK